MRCIVRLLSVLLLLGVAVQAGAAADAPDIDLGQSTLPLTGPWKFHTGDDPRWADAAYDDSSWESVDLKAPPGATDGDVGLDGYVSGWNSKGHPGYHGYAWYRLHVRVTAPGEALALLGPWAVDSAYQVYVNGTLLGGVGDFAGTPPTAYGYHYPTSFPLTQAMAHGGAMTIAIRVWAGPWVSGPDSGGIHIAPVVGEQDAITGLYRLQWLKIFEGYAVDAVPALLFFLMALLSLCLAPFVPGDRFYLWLPVALVLSGIQRGNQAFFFWWRVESIQAFVLVILVLVSSLSLAAWMMAWRSWFKLDKPAWLGKAIAALTLILMLAQLLGYASVFGASLPHGISLTAHYFVTCARRAFLLVLAFTVYQGMRRWGREAWYALPAVLAIGTVLFASELSAVHVPGIWFPWGVGLSLSEIASVAFDLLLAALLLRRLWPRAPSSTHSEMPA